MSKCHIAEPAAPGYLLPKTGCPRLLLGVFNERNGQFSLGGVQEQPVLSSRKIMLSAALLTIFAGASVAQLRRGGGRGFGGVNSGPIVRIEEGGLVNEDTVRTARETARHSVEMPNWTNAPGFEKDVFTFARIIFKSRSDGRFPLGWWVDYPDADLNLSYRLQQLTSMKVDPDARVLKLTDPTLFDFPLIYMEHAGYMQLNDEEIGHLRRHLLNGGALFVNDFWGTREWEGFAAQMKHVLPERSWEDLPMDHPVFHGIFDLKGPLNNLQVPTMQFWNRQYDPGNEQSRVTRYRGEGYEDMHVRALLDDKRRIMVIAVHNSDISDGWEREGENEEYFKEYSETRAYPLAINIIFYLMTH